MRIAFCYDRINKFGGAERVLAALHEIWPVAPFYTLTYSKKNAPWASSWKIFSSFLDKIPIVGKKHELFPPVAALAWQQFDFRNYDVVVSITSSEAKSIVTPKNVLHVCYCLTPTRYYWSGYFDYLNQSGKGILGFGKKLIFTIFAHFLRVNDYFEAQRPDLLIGISDEVCRRISKYYRRDSLKIYPPVLVSNTKISKSSLFELPNKKPYFLVVSRLVSYKHVEIVVDAFNISGIDLVIVGTGSEVGNLKSMAKSNVHFEGFVHDDKLSWYYLGCVAVIFSANEDFGIVPVEAQSYGKPVVAFRGGGALETVVEGKTGIFFDHQTAESLNNCIFRSGNNSSDIVKFFNSCFLESDCKINAARFSKENFQARFKEIIEANFIKKEYNVTKEREVV